LWGCGVVGVYGVGLGCSRVVLESPQKNISQNVRGLLFLYQNAFTCASFSRNKKYQVQLSGKKR